MRRNVRRRSRFKSHRGAALVELALLLPLLLTLVLGTIEICQRIFVRQSATLIAYEGARLAVRRTATTAQITSRCQTLLADRRIVNGQVTVSPSPVEAQPTGTAITVQINVPWSVNTPIVFTTVGASDISARAVMVRE